MQRSSWTFLAVSLERQFLSISLQVRSECWQVGMMQVTTLPVCLRKACFTQCASSLKSPSSPSPILKAITLFGQRPCTSLNLSIHSLIPSQTALCTPSFAHSLLLAVNLVMQMFIVATTATDSPFLVACTWIDMAVMGLFMKGTPLICQGFSPNFVYMMERWRQAAASKLKSRLDGSTSTGWNLRPVSIRHYTTFSHPSFYCLLISLQCGKIIILLVVPDPLSLLRTFKIYYECSNDEQPCILQLIPSPILNLSPSIALAISTVHTLSFYEQSHTTSA